MIRVGKPQDKPPHASALTSLLQQHPEIAVVGLAYSGAEAIDHAIAKHPHVVVMDVRMPGMDGIEATRRLVAEAPGARVIATTGIDDEQIVERALEAGASRFIRKDDLPHELLDAVLELVAERVPRRAW
jgi:DNA-binding NarL/FixJ family response regulator